MRLDSMSPMLFDCRLDWIVKHFNATIHSLDGGNEATKMTFGLRGGGSLTGQRGQLLGNQHDLNFALSRIGCRRYLRVILDYLNSAQDVLATQKWRSFNEISGKQMLLGSGVVDCQWKKGGKQK